MRKKWFLLASLMVVIGMLPSTILAAGWDIQGYHSVRAGETLYSIGRAYATRPEVIATVNGISTPNRLWVGQRLAIPVAPWSPIPAGPIAVRQFGGGSTDPTPTCRYWHAVRYGETLTRISYMYGVNMWAIAAANRLYNLNLIYAGQVLCIP